MTSNSSADKFGSSGHHSQILAALPHAHQVIEVREQAKSAWAEAFQVRILDSQGLEHKYFMKTSYGHHGREALRGEFEGTSAIHAITPEFCPRPIAWGTFTSQPDTHFYLCKYFEFAEGIPSPSPFCEKLARLHSRSCGLVDNFGFHCTTYNGDLPQDNTWCPSWEQFFSRGMRHVLRVRETRAGPNPELEALLPNLFDKVIPRLLRALESDGRKIKPSLIHGDLWYGNASVIRKTGDPVIYDPACFWAHNEYELGNWHPERNRFGKEFYQEYHRHIPKSDPVEDYDDRNVLYGLRFNLHAATLFPDKVEFLELVLRTLRYLTEKYQMNAE
ncbi:Fructosamine kinase-domain-containing protein [Apiosordaria backusii]|uniref:protein-ribulosamine 3-kinase n=1 Tax=Apiosordaria backusii TaxID=314023 RepID=A0AA40EA46_9PEZI|nr:Fructosamine kinase-domain-containing protein [Apiosordaria backusii]